MHWLNILTIEDKTQYILEFLSECKNSSFKHSLIKTNRIASLIYFLKIKVEL